MPRKDFIDAHPNKFRKHIAKFRENIVNYEAFTFVFFTAILVALTYLLSLALQTGEADVSRLNQKVIPVAFTAIGLVFAAGNIIITFGSKKLEIFDRYRPSINVYCKDIGNQVIEVVISNVGRGDAEALSLELVPSDFSVGSEVNPKCVSIFTLEILATGKEIRQLLPAEITGQLLLKFQSEDGLSHSKIFPVNSVNQIREAALKQLTIVNLNPSTGCDKDEYDWGGTNPLTIGYPVYHEPGKGLMVFEEER